MRSSRLIPAAALFLSVFQPLAAQETISLATADTLLRFDAASARLIELQTADGSTWKNRAADDKPRWVEIDGRRVSLLWNSNPSLSRSDAHALLVVFECLDPHLRLTSEWQARAQIGPLEHQIRIENLDRREIWLPLLDSLRFDWRIEPGEPLSAFFVEKGADTPSPVGTHRVAVLDGFLWEGTSSSYADPLPGEPREIIPFLLVERANPAQSGWYAGIEFSGRTRLSLERSGEALHGVVGLNPKPASAGTRLRSGDTFESPTIFLGGATGGPDAVGNVLHRWERSVLLNPADWANPQYPVLTNNTWGSGMHVDEALALRMLKDSAELGFEMLHIDAGWFRAVGDWHPDAKKFPRGLAPIAAQAHALNMKLGLWVDWTQAGLSKQPGALNVDDPKVRNWLVADPSAGWKPEEFKGQTIDIGASAAREWAASELERLVTENHLDMLEHDGYIVAQGCVRRDHPHTAPDPANLRIRQVATWSMVESSNSTDVSYHASRAYYRLYSELRQKHPALLLEVCNDGGRMVDFGSAAHADYFSITDTYDPLSNRRAFHDTSYVLPPAMLETYVEKWPAPTIGNIRYMLRSGMMGWLSIMLDTTVWSPEQRHAAQQEFALYKSALRPLIRDADLYHISARPDGVHWDAIEYFDPARAAGVVYAFRGSIADESTHIFLLKGLRSDRNYRLRFHDQSSPDATVPGQQLLRSGLPVVLNAPYNSELIFLSEVP